MGIHVTETRYIIAVQWKASFTVSFTWNLETITGYIHQLIGIFLVVGIFQVNVNQLI